MPRQPRYFIPGYPQHIIQRGVDRQATFFQPRDYRRYLRVLADASKKYDCRIHAYVLMTNHTHLLVTPGTDKSLPSIMQAIGRQYVQSTNKSYERTGTLWEGRYKACLVQDDQYLLACQRYIELNPVRSGIVSSPGEYPFSSYRHNALGYTDRLVTPHPIFLELGESDRERRESYKSLFSDQISEDLLKSIRAETNSCLAIGNDKFKDQIEAMIGRSVRPAKMGRPRKATEVHK